jgi:hypothetical protein
VLTGGQQLQQSPADRVAQDVERVHTLMFAQRLI